MQPACGRRCSIVAVSYWCTIIVVLVRVCNGSVHFVLLFPGLPLTEDGARFLSEPERVDAAWRIEAKAGGLAEAEAVPPLQMDTDGDYVRHGDTYSQAMRGQRFVPRSGQGSTASCHQDRRAVWGYHGG